MCCNVEEVGKLGGGVRTAWCCSKEQIWAANGRACLPVCSAIAGDVGLELGLLHAGTSSKDQGGLNNVIVVAGALRLVLVCAQISLGMVGLAHIKE